MPDPRRPLPGWVDFAMLLALVAIVYLPAALRARDLNFDDPFFFGDGAFAGGLLRVWDPSRPIANAFLPVSHTSLWIDWKVFGPDSAGPRIHALLLHALAAFVLARSFVRLGVGRIAALAGAALFALHPALAESVAWVSGRKDVLSGLFVFLAVDASIRIAQAGQRPEGARGASWALLGWTVLALYSKSTAVVLPLLVALPLLGLARPRRFALVGAVTLLTIAAGLHHTSIAIAEGTLAPHADLPTRLTQVPGAFWHYLATTFWPTGLNVLYPEVQTMEWFRSILWPALAALVGFALAVLAAVRTDRRLLAGALVAFLAALLPFNTAYPASSVAAADRYLYLAIPGMVLALVALGPRLGAGLAAVAAVACAWLAVDRARDFRDDASLWQASLDVDPDNSLALFNLAESMWERPERVEEAKDLLRRAQESARYPAHDLRASVTLMALSAATGDLDGAAADAERCVAALDRLPDGQASLDLTRETLLDAARLARFAERVDLADRWLERVQSIAPDHPDVLAFAASARLGPLLGPDGRVNPDDAGVAEVRELLERAEAVAGAERFYSVPLARAELCAALGRKMAAQKHYRKAIAIAPRHAEAHLGRAQVYLSRGIYSGAEKAVREAHALGIRDPRLKYLLGLALGGQGKLDEARSFYEAYLVGRPHDPAARKALAAVLAGQAMRDLQQLEPERLGALADRIERLDPENPKGFIVRGFALRAARDLQGALIMFEKAAAALPEDDEVARYRLEALRDRGYQCLLTEQDRQGAAHDYFRLFLDGRPESYGLQTESVANILDEAWRRTIERAREAFLAEDAARTRQLVARCLELRPEDARPRYYRGLLSFRSGEGLEGALEDFRAFVAEAERQGQDPTTGMFYEVLTLQRLGRNAEAVERADAYLARAEGEVGVAEAVVTEPDEDLVRLRAARDAAAARVRESMGGSEGGEDGGR